MNYLPLTSRAPALGRCFGRFLPQAALAALASLVFSASASAQQAATSSASDEDEPIVLDEFVVAGVRGSLVQAQEIKQNSLQLVDSIVAQDIGKLPDNTVADALQRVPGIQVGRGNGEVNSVVIRGLPNLATTLNGHEVFTGTGRGVALQDIPAELIGGVDVYKSQSASQIEGGIAGLIDIRLRRPFDFDGFAFGASSRAIFGEHASGTSSVSSALISNRWKTANGGEFGALLAASYQRIHFMDQTVFNFLWEPVNVANPAVTGGKTPVMLPVTAGSLLIPGDRKRPAYSFSLQWRPHENLEVYTDFLSMGYREKRAVHFFIGFPRDGVLFNTAQSVDFVGNTNVVDRTSTSPNNFQLTSMQAFDNKTDGYQAVVGARWTKDRLKFTTEAVYNWSKVQNRVVIVDTQFVPTTPATYIFDLNNPSGTNVTITGADVSDGANYRLWGLFDNHDYSKSDQISWQADLEYSVAEGFFSKLKGGVRITDREAEFRGTSVNDIPPADGRGTKVASTIPGFGSAAPDGLFSRSEFGASNWFAGDPNFLRNEVATIRTLFGRPTGDPAFNPATAFTDTEKTYSGYAQADYSTDFGGRELAGSVGVRLVQTEQQLTGFRSLTDPVNADQDQLDVLPFLTGRMKLDTNLIGRFSYGRTVTRPNFADLNPLVNRNAPTTTGGQFGTGSGGNPDLETVTSDNFDVALEYYFGRSSYASVAGFYRSIDGYVQSFATVEEFNGQQYIITRPRNAGKGHLQGLEVAYQQFFDFLPGVLRGLGVHANYTYITGEQDADDPTDPATPPRRTQLAYPLVSKHSYNIVGIYERGPFSLRLAYNWRGKYVDTFNGPNSPLSGLRTITAKDTDQLDFSASYELRKGLLITLDATNLLDSEYQDYFADPNLYPRDTRKYDRRVEVGLRYRY